MDKEQAKAKKERGVFRDFVRMSGLHIDEASIESGQPPEPDILACSVTEGSLAFELVELCDPNLARIYGQREPLEDFFAWLGGANVDAVRAKFTNAYSVSCPLELLCYQAGRDPTPGDILIPSLKHELDFAAQSTFRRVWYMDNKSVEVLFAV